MNNQEHSEKNNSVTKITGKPIMPSPTQIIYARRMYEAVFANNLLKSLTGTPEEIAKIFTDSLVFQLGHAPKQSCRHCYGRAYNGFTDVSWYVSEDGSISLEAPRTGKSINRIHYTRIYPCTCISSFTATTVDKLNDGDLYIHMDGDKILTHRRIEQENEKKD